MRMRKKALSRKKFPGIFRKMALLLEAKKIKKRIKKVLTNKIIYVTYIP